MNKTFLGLALSRHLFRAPLFVPNINSRFGVMKSRFSNSISPIIYGSSFSLSLKSVSFKNSLSAVISYDRVPFCDISIYHDYCSEQAIEATNLEFEGNFNETIIQIDAGRSSANFSNCVFSKCTIIGETSLVMKISCPSVSLIAVQILESKGALKLPAISLSDITKGAYLQNITIDNFTQYIEPVEEDTEEAKSSEVEEAVPLILISSGTLLTIDNITINQYENTTRPLIQANSVSIIRAQKIFATSETQLNQSSIVFINLTQGLVTLSAFKGFTDKIIQSDGKLIVSNICVDNLSLPESDYLNLSDSEIVLMNGDNNLLLAKDNIARQSCPLNPSQFMEFEEELTNSEKTYAIITIVFFVIFFLALFVVMITFIFCKRDGTDEPHYGEIQAVSDDALSSSTSDYSL